MAEGKAVLSITIRAVDSMPCDFKGQTLEFDEKGNVLSEHLKAPWKTFNWVEEEITKYATGEYTMPEEDSFRIYNPEEPDQYVFVGVKKLS